MKILDRYVAASFIKNYFLSFAVLLGLYVVLDMLFNFNSLVTIQEKAGLSGIATVLGLLATSWDYYYHQSFVFFVQISAIIPVVAAAFTLMRLSRFNELSAMLSAGVPLLRVTLPVIIVAVVLNGLVLVDQEVAIPGMIPKLIRKSSEAGQASSSSFAIPSMQDDDNRLLVAAVYHPGVDAEAAWMESVSIIQRNHDLLPTGQITADLARWDSERGCWNLKGAVMTMGLAPGGKPTTRPMLEPYYSQSVTPEKIALYRSHDYVQLLSTERINELLAGDVHYNAGFLLRVKHTRFTQPIMNIILLLLAIPCVLTREPGRLKAAATKCLVLTGLCMGSIFLTSMLAQSPPNAALAEQWPAIVAWVPVFVFGPVAVWLLDHVQT